MEQVPIVLQSQLIFKVHTASQSGINETAIAVSDSLGNGDLTNDGVRIFDFSAETTNTPDYSGFGVSNFYTNSLYAEASDPGVSGTQEATVRLGVIKHDTTDYSSGYLPAGPDRSGDTGTQYFTFAFQRRAVANFELEYHQFWYFWWCVSSLHLEQILIPHLDLMVG